MNNQRASFRIRLGEQDITTKIAPRLINLTLTECREDESDQLDLSLTDHDGLLVIPPRGASIHLMIGWTEAGLVDKGEFTVDEVEHCGAPDVITIRARTANLIDQFRHPIEESYDQTTLGTILEKIANRHHLALAVSTELKNISIPHIDQTRESDAAFLRRLGKKYDAAATIKNSTLLFIPASKGKTSSGQDLPVVQINRHLGDHHRYHTSERDAYSGVQVYWYDERFGIRRSVVAGVPGNCKRLRTTYANETDARTAAVGEWQRLQRGLATFELGLALGNTALIVLSPVRVSGFKTDIDQTEWITSRVTHSLNENGFTTRIECETYTESAETVEEESIDPEPDITGVLVRWHDLASRKKGEVLAPTIGSKKERKPAPGADINPKLLREEPYATKAGAQHAADREWEKIVMRRKLIEENELNH